MGDQPEPLSAILAEMRAARNAASDMVLLPNDWLIQWADRIEAAVKSRFEDIRSLCQSEIDCYLSDHISAIFMLKVVRESADDQLRRLAQGKEARDA